MDHHCKNVYCIDDQTAHHGVSITRFSEIHINHTRLMTPKPFSTLKTHQPAFLSMTEKSTSVLNCHFQNDHSSPFPYIREPSLWKETNNTLSSPFTSLTINKSFTLPPCPMETRTREDQQNFFFSMNI